LRTDTSVDGMAARVRARRTGKLPVSARARDGQDAHAPLRASPRRVLCALRHCVLCAMVFVVLCFVSHAALCCWMPYAMSSVSNVTLGAEDGSVVWRMAVSLLPIVCVLTIRLRIKSTLLMCMRTGRAMRHARSRPHAFPMAVHDGVHRTQPVASKGS